jgi:putative addiction module killer protein
MIAFPESKLIRNRKWTLRFRSIEASFIMMDAEPQTLQEYVTSEGKNPFREWLNGLGDINARAKVRVRLNRVRLGNLGDAKSVGGGVFELRVPCGPGYGVYFARTGNTVVMLLCGGDKSTQKRDIRTAKDYWLDYQRRSS